MQGRLSHLTPVIACASDFPPLVLHWAEDNDSPSSAPWERSASFPTSRFPFPPLCHTFAGAQREVREGQLRTHWQTVT